MGRAPCCSKIGLNRGPWSLEEDKLLIHYIQTHGEGHWRSLPSKAGLLRCGKSCRLRWVNYLRPGVKRGNFTSEENDTIIRLHSLHGNRWSFIAAEFPGRTDNEIKNHWNTHLRKKAVIHRNDQDTKNINHPQPTMAPLYNNLESSSLTEHITEPTKDIMTDVISMNNVLAYDDCSVDDIKVKSEMTNNVISYENHLTDVTKVESKIVKNDIETSTSSSGTSYSSSVTTEGEVNMVTDNFFYELDDFIDVDQKMKSCYYRDDGTKQLEKVYMEYLQLLNYGAE